MNLPKFIQYAKDVQDGTVLVGKYVKKDVERFLKDLDREDWEWTFRPDLAAKYIDYIEANCKHTRGSWAGKPFILSPWQAYYLGQLFGWVSKVDGKRRFVTSYLYVGRKSGKSQMAAGIAMAMAALDGDGAGEYVFAATTRQQARMVFDEVQRAMRKLPTKERDKFAVMKHHIEGPNDSRMRPVSSDAHTLDGLSLNLGVVDEYHAMKDSHLLDVLKSSMGSRKSPLLLAITTAGFIPDGPAAKAMKAGKDVLNGHKEDERTLCLIYQIDKGDEFDDVKCWAKANPGLGESITEDYLRAQLTQAKNLGPAAIAEFKVKHCNLFVQSSEAWLEVEKWDAMCDESLKELVTPETPCYIGVDLAKSSDVTCVALLWDLGDEGFYTETHHFLPDEAVERAIAKDAATPYRELTESQWAHITPDSNVTDYSSIRKLITGRYEDERGQLAETDDCLMSRHNVKGIGYDPWASSQLMIQLESYDGAPCLPVRQGTTTLNPCVNAFEEHYLEGHVYHSDDTFMRWMVSNCILETNAAGHRKPSKKRSAEKIDGLAALLNAFAIWLVDQVPEEDDSIPEAWSPRWL